MSGKPLYTIGYSRFSLEDFLDTLKGFGVNAVVDVRAMPHVSSFDAFKRDNLKRELAAHGIVYKFFGKILGARPEQMKFYTDGRVDFEKIRASAEFLETCRNLETGMKKGFAICLMCAQNDPIICHRSILITRHFARMFPRIPIRHLRPGGIAETQEELDQRVLKLYRDALYRDSLLGCAKGGDELEMAYRWQGGQIAYKLDRQ